MHIIPSLTLTPGMPSQPISWRETSTVFTGVQFFLSFSVINSEVKL